MEILRRISALIQKIFIDGTCLVLLFLVIVVVSFQVFNRFLFHLPLAWTEELSRYLFVWLSLLGAVRGVRDKAHIQVDLFLDLFPKKAQLIFDLLINTLVLVLLISVIISGMEILPMTLRRRAPTMNVSMFYLYVGIPISSALMILYILKNGFKDVQGLTFKKFS
jgi:TRAP-type C4-dicarboxylate transport system permease small subunit